MRDRTYARELVIQELYRLELLKEEPLEEDLRAILRKRAQKEDVVAFAILLISGYFEHRQWIDQIASQFLKDWELHRIPSMDRQILRMGIYEIFFQDTIPFQATINEAIELAKRFSTAKSGSFINGVLDKIASQKDQLIEKTPPEKN